MKSIEEAINKAFAPTLRRLDKIQGHLDNMDEAIIALKETLKGTESIEKMVLSLKQDVQSATRPAP